MMFPENQGPPLRERPFLSATDLGESWAPASTLRLMPADRVPDYILAAPQRG
jgi:hypothetical protein